MMRRGFSLLELSIVLVILGLLAGGIVAGQSLIRASELRAITTDFNRYSAAITSFRQKYDGLPGDIVNATSYWGKSSTYCNSYADAAATPGTCNGNGDGVIAFTGGANATSEGFRAWQQLALAGFIEGVYTGVAGTANGTDHVFGTNSPQSKMTGVGWGITYFDNSSGGNSVDFAVNYLNWLTVGGDDDSYADTPFLKPEDAWNIDAKIDDGKPGQGDVQSWLTNNCTTATGPTDFNATYARTNTSGLCSMFFKY